MKNELQIKIALNLIFSEIINFFSQIIKVNPNYLVLRRMFSMYIVHYKYLYLEYASGPPDSGELEGL